MKDRAPSSSRGASKADSKSNPPQPAPSGAAPADRRRGSASTAAPAAAPAGAQFTGLSPGGDVVDRRSGLDRRKVREAMGEVWEQETGLERRRGPGRRRTDFAKAAEEGEMTKEQFLFVMAIDAFKRANGRMFPTWTDVLEVIRLLGYRKTMPSALNLSSAEDWLEKPDAPHGVRSKPGHPEGESRPGRQAA
jgi:hypothetical protein